MMVKRLEGKRFGRLLVKEFVEIAKCGHARWLCICDCGNEHLVISSHLKSGNVQSCGCLAREVTLKLRTTHGAAAGGKNTPEYTSWQHMKDRCLNSNNDAWEDYGGRGIGVCIRWVLSFADFLSDMGTRPPGTSLERIDNNGNYEPSNCRWATRKEQSNNRRMRVA